MINSKILNSGFIPVLKVDPERCSKEKFFPTWEDPFSSDFAELLVKDNFTPIDSARMMSVCTKWHSLIDNLPKIYEKIVFASYLDPAKLHAKNIEISHDRDAIYVEIAKLEALLDLDLAKKTISLIEDETTQLELLLDLSKIEYDHDFCQPVETIESPQIKIGEVNFETSTLQIIEIIEFKAQNGCIEEAKEIIEEKITNPIDKCEAYSIIAKFDKDHDSLAEQIIQITNNIDNKDYQLYYLLKVEKFKTPFNINRIKQLADSLLDPRDREVALLDCLKIAAQHDHHQAKQIAQSFGDPYLKAKAQLEILKGVIINRGH